MDASGENQDAIEEAGLMSARDWRRLCDLAIAIQATGSISDADLDWIITLARSPLVSTTDNILASHNLALGYSGVSSLQHLTPLQADKLFEVALDYFSMPEEEPFAIINGCKTMMWLRDKRAIPILIPLLKDSRPTVRYRANEALTSLDHF